MPEHVKRPLMALVSLGILLAVAHLPFRLVRDMEMPQWGLIAVFAVGGLSLGFAMFKWLLARSNWKSRKRRTRADRL